MKYTFRTNERFDVWIYKESGSLITFEEGISLMSDSNWCSNLNNLRKLELMNEI